VIEQCHYVVRVAAVGMAGLRLIFVEAILEHLGNECTLSVMLHVLLVFTLTVYYTGQVTVGKLSESLIVH